MQRQQPANYDLLAVFPDETKAEAASTKLRKEGFTDDEVHQLTANSAGQGVFREHGPNNARREVFLQTKRSGPNPAMIILLAIIFGVVLGGLTFAAQFALPSIPEPLTMIVGIAAGLVLGAIIGLLQRGRVRGAIGQEQQKSSSGTAPKTLPNTKTVVALRFEDPDNISRMSRARAILLNNQGKIDRSVGRRE